LPDLVPFPELKSQNFLTVKYNGVFALKTDGTVVTTDSDLDLSDWTDIVALFSRGVGDPIGLKADGTVVTTDIYRSYEHWTDIRFISDDVALKSDGTVVTPAPDRSTDRWARYRDELSELSNVEKIFTIGNSVIAIKFDGTLVAVGSNSIAQQAANEWSDIVDISSAPRAIFGLRADGTLVGIVDDYHRARYYEAAYGWTDIVAISTTLYSIAGLKSDGTVVVAGAFNDVPYGPVPNLQSLVDGWTDITAIVAGAMWAAGLRADGTVVVTGFLMPDGSIVDGFTHPDTSGWTDIIAIWLQNTAEHERNIIGLRSDGTLLTAGRGVERGNLNIDGWSNIKTTAGGR
jgi:hypothetical protein